MIDSHFRSPWQQALIDPLAELFMRLRARPHHLTVAAAAFGLLCFMALAFHLKWLALLTLLISGLLDATDGTLARKLKASSDAGCILDVACDRLVEAAVVLGLYLYEPASRGWPLLCLLSSFYLCVTTFLLSGIFETNRSNKSFHYSPGLIERSETFIFFPLIIVFEGTFYWATLIFSVLVCLTAFMRFFEMMRLFSRTPSELTSLTTLDARDQATTMTMDPAK